MSDNTKRVKPNLVIETGATEATRRIANAVHKALADELNLDHEVHAYAPSADHPFGRVVYSCMRLNTYCDFEVELLDYRGSACGCREDVHGFENDDELPPHKAVRAWLKEVREYEAWKDL